MGYLLSALSEATGLLARGDPEVARIVLTSLRVSVASCLLASLAGIPAGVALGLARFPGRRAVLLVLNTLMALPTVVVGLVVYGMIGRQGPLGSLALLYTPTGIVIGETLLALPLVTNLVLAATEGVDDRVVPTCRSLGGGRVAVGRAVLWEARLGVLAAVVAGFGRVIGEVGVAMMVGGNIRGYTRTMTTAIALETSKGDLELGLALGMVLLTVAFAVNAVVFLVREVRR